MTIFGNIPGEDFSYVRGQKLQIEANLRTLGVELPSWIVTNSYLADLKTLQRIILAAHKARPGVTLSSNVLKYTCCMHCDHSTEKRDAHVGPCSEPECQPETPGNPDSSTEGAPDGVDRAIQA